MEALNLEEIIGASTAKFVLHCAAFARYQFNARTFLIGGCVRDALLGIALLDIDLMFEGDATEIVKAIYEKWAKNFPETEMPARPIIFKKFKTVKLNFQNPFDGRYSQFDFSSARKEIYQGSAAQPIVTLATVEDDFKRRDFSVNAIAAEIGDSNVAKILDPMGGRKDLENKKLRILHSQSFEDDPARLIRGIRFLVRFGFDWEGETKKFADAAVVTELIKKLPPIRLFDEFRKALREKRWRQIVSELDKCGLLCQINPRFCVSKIDVNGALSLDSWEERLLALTYQMTVAELRDALIYFEVGKKIIDRIVSLQEGMMSGVGNAARN